MMRRKIGASKVKIYFDENSLIIGISGDAKIRTLDAIMKELTVASKRQSYDIAITDIVLDLSYVRWISPAAAVGLVCLCSALMTNRMEEIASPSNFYVRLPSDSVLSYLATLSFFTQMNDKAYLMQSEGLVHFEDEREKRRIEKQKALRFNASSSDGLKPIIFPMKTIPRKGSSSGRYGKDFEDACGSFVNQVYSTFEELFSSRHFNFDQGDMYGFCSANGELFVNIFEHSDSWGLGAVHADPARGTTVMFHDIGVGIKGSVNSSPKAGREFEQFETDYRAMEWAVKEGHSRKLNGNGRGLTVVEEFVLDKDGTIEIRSGCCSLYKMPGDAPGEKSWRHKDLPWLPGTQINFFVPCITAKIKEDTYGNYRVQKAIC